MSLMIRNEARVWESIWYTLNLDIIWIVFLFKWDRANCFLQKKKKKKKVDTIFEQDLHPWIKVNFSYPLACLQ
jgi:hypothetical protein